MQPSVTRKFFEKDKKSPESYRFIHSRCPIRPRRTKDALIREKKKTKKKNKQRAVEEKRLCQKQKRMSKCIERMKSEMRDVREN